jgi:hypothetical protein
MRINVTWFPVEQADLFNKNEENMQAGMSMG